MLGERYIPKELIKRYRILICMAIGGFILSFKFYGGSEEFWNMVIRMLISIPINAILTTFLLDSIFKCILRRKERKKINMLIDIFYSEIGNDILKVISKADKCAERIKCLSTIKKEWLIGEYQKIFDDFDNFENCLDIDKLDLDLLRKLLEDATPISIHFLTNTSLQDREEFKEIVLAILHLKKDLDYKDIENDKSGYIKKEIEELYLLLSKRWMNYMYHLEEFKPRLFERALLNSPFVRKEKNLK